MLEMKTQDFIDLLCRHAKAHGVYREGVGNPADPTHWSTITCYINLDSYGGPSDEQTLRLQINQSWGTEIRLTWLAPRNMLNKRNRVKIDAYYDNETSRLKAIRPFTQEHFDSLLGLMLDPCAKWETTRYEEEMVA